MSYPCYFLRGDSGGLVCVDMNFFTCLCLFTDVNELQAFQDHQRQRREEKAFSLDPAFITCHTRDDLISRLTVMKDELAKSEIRHLAINPTPELPVAFIPIEDFIEQLPPA
jgi:hypothetical protein